MHVLIELFAGWHLVNLIQFRVDLAISSFVHLTLLLLPSRSCRSTTRPFHVLFPFASVKIRAQRPLTAFDGQVVIQFLLDLAYSKKKGACTWPLE